jgi:hypothetical protein
MAPSTTTGAILLDAPDGEGRFERSMLERLGHAVIECSGPAPGELCPLLRDGDCDLFEQAYGIVFELDLDRPQHRAILREYQALAPEDLPIRVVVDAEQRARYGGEFDGVMLWDHEPTIADLDGLAAQIESLDRFG